jgi:hypothetical protein
VERALGPNTFSAEIVIDSLTVTIAASRDQAYFPSHYDRIESAWYHH